MPRPGAVAPRAARDPLAPVAFVLMLVLVLVLEPGAGRAAAGPAGSPLPGPPRGAADRGGVAGAGRAAQVTQLKEEAQALIRAGDIAGARDRYRQALDLAPEDVEARFGYARTSGWLEEYAEAERAYREGLARTPNSVEGLVGLADVLAWTGRYDEALALLGQAEQTEPDSPDVVRRQGRFNRWRGDRAAAQAAYRRTLELAPGDEEATRALAELAAETTSTLELSYSREELSAAKAARLGTGANNLASLQYTYTGFRRLTLLGRVTYSDKFGDHRVDGDDFQLGAGAAWRLRPRMTLRAEAAVAPDADTLPAFAGEVELLQGLSLGKGGNLVAGLGYRFLDFNRNVRLDASGRLVGVDPNTQVHIITPSVEWTTPWPLVLFLRYYYSISDFETIPRIGSFPGLAGGTDETSSILVKATFVPRARVVPFVAYARGVESFATAAQVRGLTTDTYAAGAEIRLMPGLGLRASYEYQDSGRDTAGGSITQQNVNVGVYVKW